MKKKFQQIRIEVYKLLRNRLYLTYALVLVIGYIAVNYAVSVLSRVIPEVPMVYYSTCKNPFISWDGKILTVPVYTNGYKNRSSHYNTMKNIDGDDRRRLSSINIENNTNTYYLRKLTNDKDLKDKDHSSHVVASSHKRPVIFWGSHHKTGTYLAQKLFSSICGNKKSWCCINLVTRDSVHFVRNILSSEPNINVVGHSQWIWFPETFNVSYKFIHFYRHPFSKIISGYFYHQRGIEGWTKASLNYSRTCNNTINRHMILDRSTVVDYCSGVHLCQGCCRKEHETTPHNLSVEASGRYHSRSHFEYEFICQNLGQIDTSLQNKLKASSLNEGLKIEASLDYYENLRMMQVVDHTLNDTNTINVNLDDLSYNFQNTIKKILMHIDPYANELETDELAKKLNFYDAETSYLYRVLHNLFNREHIHKKSQRYEDVQRFYKILQEDKNIMRLYTPILDIYKKIEKTIT